MGHIRTWEQYADREPEGDDALIMKIGWITGWDAEGRTLYYYSTNECRQLLEEWRKSCSVSL